MWPFKKNKTSKYVPIEYHQMRLQKWDDFIKTCEKFDYVVFKGHSAVGYMAGESREAIFSGTILLIPFEMIISYTELDE
jgi:hypothetical protein